jgi:hypothetical protein
LCGTETRPLGLCAVGLVGDLLGEGRCPCRYLTDEGGGFLGVVIVLGEDQRLRHLRAAGKPLVRAFMGILRGTDIRLRNEKRVGRNLTAPSIARCNDDVNWRPSVPHASG